jgi:integrase
VGANRRVALKRANIAKAKVPEGARQLMLWDAVVPGLGVRCLSGGSKTWLYRYRPNGGGRNVNPRLFKLGTFPALGLDDARAAARICAGKIAKGEDPAQARAEERRRERATLGTLLAEDGPYERHLKGRGLVNVKTALSSLRRGLKAYMAVDVAALSRGDIVASIDALTGLGKRGAAADLRRHARAFLEWAVAQGLAKFNPMAGLRAPPRTRHQRLLDADKGRALDDDEIIAVWRAAQAMQDRAGRGEAVSGTFGGLIQLALLTAMRRGELAQLRHDNLLIGARARQANEHNIFAERVNLPKEITKTGTAHDVPLTPLMRAVIGAQPRGTSPLVFPSRQTGGRLSGWSTLVAALRSDSGVDVALHDLRRTCRTLMSRLGVSEDVAELAIGHQRADLVARYNKDHAWPGRADAFARVSVHVAELLAAAADERGTVVTLAASRPAS